MSSEASIETLSNFLQTIPGFEDRTLIGSSNAHRIARYLIDDYFMVHRHHIPDLVIDESTLTAREEVTYATSGTLSKNDELEYWYANITSTIANYQAVKRIKELEVEQEKQNQADIALAFTLFKASNPANLKYVSWNRIPRHLQDSWLTVVAKAREELTN